MSLPLEEFLNFALELSSVAELEILPRYRACGVSRKADGSEVTEADRRAEQAMRERIAARYPQHGIVGEEFGGALGAGLQWVLDPVDGTAWFTMGVPLFGTLIALAEDGDPACGVIHFPALRETVYAARGLGCWLRAGDAAPRQVRVARAAAINEAVISASGSHHSDIQPPPGRQPVQLSALIRRAGKFKFVADCMQHALVCQGRIHAAIDPIMSPWDIAALVPCVREAGGVAVSVAGRSENICQAGSLITACSAALAAEVVAVLAAPSAA